MKKTAIVLSILILLISVMPAFSASAYTPTFKVNAKKYILKNTDTGDVIDSNGIQDKIYPASITMMMTAYVAKQQMTDFQVSVVCKNEIIDSFYGSGLLVAYLKQGEIVTLEDLMYLTLIGSYNDAASVLADYVAGSEKAFVKMMNDTAKQLGMKNTHFSVVNGKHDENNYTTIEDLCILSDVFFADEYLLEISSTDSYSMAATNLTVAREVVTTNLLLSRYSGYYYKYAVAGKTGVSDEAGRCLVCIASKDGANYLCIVTGCDTDAVTDTGATSRPEYSDTVSLFKWAFFSFEYKILVNEGEAISSAKVKLSWDVDEFSLVAQNTVSALVPSNADESSLIFETTLNYDNYNQDSTGYFIAPVIAGEVYGTATVIYADQIVGEVNLVAANSVDRSFTLLIWDFIQKIFFNGYMVVILATLIIGFIIFVFVFNGRNKSRRKRR